MVKKLQKQAELDEKLKILENQTVREFEIKNYETPTQSIISKNQIMRSQKVMKLQLESEKLQKLSH